MSVYVCVCVSVCAIVGRLWRDRLVLRDVRVYLRGQLLLHCSLHRAATGQVAFCSEFHFHSTLRQA